MVFLDTSAFLAIIDENDIKHTQAAKTWSDLLQTETRLVCNNYVLLETLALIQNRFGMDTLRIFQEQAIPHLDIEWLTEAEHTEAMYYLLLANRRRLSLVDCSVFASMRRLGIREVFTFDEHFAEQGFDVLPVING
jgi:predicted nucleic acid-binding protein